MNSTAKQEGVGVTVIARGRVDLSPGRDDMAVLREIREIGGEQYLYDFAQYTKRGLDEQRMPPPPTIQFRDPYSSR
jgi:hypothetical protein